MRPARPAAAILLAISTILPAPASLGGEAAFDGSWQGDPPAGDLLSVSAGTIPQPDIVCSTRTPHVGEKVVLSARIRGKAARQPLEVLFSLASEGGEPIKLQAKAAAGDPAEYATYRADWQPREPGFYRFSVQVDPGGKSGDPFTENNTAWTTVPVTWTELHLLSWNAPTNCRWTGSAVYVEKPADIPYWRWRGSKPLGYMTVLYRDLVDKTQEELTGIMLSNAKAISEAGYDGYLIDELGVYPSEKELQYVHRLTAAYEAVQARFPKLRGYNWTGGAMLREEADMARRVGHILMSESYPDIIVNAFGTHSFEKHLEHRIENARNADALFTHGAPTCTIIALGIGGDCGIPAPPDVENWVRVCRRMAPEAPGICYYPGMQGDFDQARQARFQEFLDRLTLDYFLKPVIMLRENDIYPDHHRLRAGQAVDIIARVRNIGGMAARNVGVSVFAREMASNQRTAIVTAVLKEIRNGIHSIQENSPPSFERREINGVTYPAMYYKGRQEVGTTHVYWDRALLTASWTPAKPGHYRLEVEISPSPHYTVLEGFGHTTVIVGD